MYRRGISLIEILIALAILSFAIIPVSAFFQYTILDTAKNTSILTATQLADSIATDLMEIISFDDLRDPKDPQARDFTLENIKLYSRKNPDQVVLDLEDRVINNTQYSFSLKVETIQGKFLCNEEKQDNDKEQGSFIRSTYETYRKLKKLKLNISWQARNDSRREIEIVCIRPNI